MAAEIVRFEHAHSERVRHQHVTFAPCLHEARHADRGIGAQLQRIAEVVVQPPQDTVDGFEPGDGLQKDAIAADGQIAAFRQSRLGRHKSDRADATLLVRFAELHQAELRHATPDEPDLARLRALVGYRDDLAARRTRLRNQRHAAQWAEEATVVAWLEADLAELATRLAAVERAIGEVLVTRPETAVLTAQLGVGMMVAAAVLAYLPAGVLGNAKAAAAYAGLHPRHEQSGQRRSRLSKQGCPALRRYLYLAALTAIQHDPEIQAWHITLRGRGKAPKSATCAVAHKLLRRMMGRIRALRNPHPALLPAAA